MLRGDYAGALAVYRGVADIADLEPGLLPASMRREAAASAVTGGAASVQVARLMEKCERCILRGFASGYHRVRACPLGVDVVLRPGATVAEQSRERETVAREVASGAHCVPAAAVGDEKDPAAAEVPLWMRVVMSSTMRRIVVTVGTGASMVRCVVGGQPAWVEDNHGVRWHLPRSVPGSTSSLPWKMRLMALDAAGAAGTVSFVALRPVPAIVAKAIEGAPDGAMSDALRSAVPVCEIPEAQRNLLHEHFLCRTALQHVNLLTLFGYSLSVEGVLTAIRQFAPGGTLRDLLARYRRFNVANVLHYHRDVCAALAYLHDHSYIHGAVSLDNIVIGADGACRLAGFCSGRRGAQNFFARELSYYVSPAMAAGAAPTQACDMFCYGLMSVEMASGQPPWRWAETVGGQPPHGTAEDLVTLMREGGRAFSEAVVRGTVEVHVELLNGAPLFSPLMQEMQAATLQLLSPDPAARPSAAQTLRLVERLVQSLSS
ncbi:Protein tyrosine kinase/Protein kinase domain containing protein [Novymonas esmeraldas]|uniref:Protein tyrosine kinase/Protein kinase domain containing protein n=1 Tax=Novymonas esmeraldas TaxID=1808958 RepID=A0AAW0EYL3_9TRYP